MTEAIDIFISYKREERDLADMLLAALQSEGYSAVTDLDIPSSQPFSDAIDQMIKSARLVVVLWTDASAASQWVRVEAEEAHNQEKYLGVMLDDLPSERLPLRLRGVNYLNFHELTFEDALRPILSDVTQKLGPARASRESATVKSQDVQREFSAFNGAVMMDSVLAWEAFVKEFPYSSFAPAAKAKIASLSSPMRRWTPSYKLLSLVLGVIGTALGVMKFADFPPSGPGGSIDTAQYEAVIAERDEVAGELSDLSGQYATLQTRLGQMVTEKDTALNDLELRNETLSKEVADLTAHHSELQKIRDDQSAELKSKAEELTAALDRLKAGGELQASLSEQLAAMKKELEERQEIASFDEKGVSECVTDGKAGLKIVDRCVALDETILHLSSTEVSDLAPLAGLTQLRGLYLSNTEVTDLAPLAGLTKLRRLTLRGVAIEDLRPLKSLDALAWLQVGDREFGTISANEKDRKEVQAFLAGL